MQPVSCCFDSLPFFIRRYSNFQQWDCFWGGQCKRMHTPLIGNMQGDLAAYQKAHLLPVREALLAAKKDVAFGFSEKGPTPDMESAIAGGLKFERIDLKATVGDLARAAKSIRNEVEAELRTSEIRAAKQALRREEALGRSMQPSRAARRAGGGSLRGAAASAAEQMTFF